MLEKCIFKIMRTSCAQFKIIEKMHVPVKKSEKMSGIKCLKTIIFLNINFKLLAGSNLGDGASKITYIYLKEVVIFVFIWYNDRKTL